MRGVIWDSEGNKSPGPEGFNMGFFKTCWPFLKQDLMDCVKEFFDFVILPKAVTTSFLTLVPKVNNPSNLDDFRPICFIGSLYRILEKFLALRLKKVIGKLVSKCQMAFVPGRNMLDGVEVVNEFLDLAKRNKMGCMMVKVNFEKAYDCLSWEYLRLLLRIMGFGSKWMSWMEALVSNSSLSILINGSPTRYFIVSRGLRQGDSLSLFLFLLVAEGLTAMMVKASNLGDFVGFNLGPHLHVEILQFEDDTLLIGDGSRNNLWSIKAILRGFELVSGLRVNLSKSRFVGFNIEDDLVQAASTFLNCLVGSSKFSFLGIPVGVNHRQQEVWNPILSRLRRRLDSWSLKHLFIGRRVVLLNSVLSSIPLYLFSFYKAPKVVIKDIIKIQRAFLWGGKDVEKKVC